MRAESPSLIDVIHTRREQLWIQSHFPSEPQGLFTLSVMSLVLSEDTMTWHTFIYQQGSY